MYSIEDFHGQRLMLFTADQRDGFVARGRSEQSFGPLPGWVRKLVEDERPGYLPDGELFAFLNFLEAVDTDNDGEADIWASRFAPPSRRIAKPGFLEIFTNSMGMLTGEEVREQFELYGYGRVASGPIVSRFRDKYEQDLALYDEDLDNQEIRARIGEEAFERFLLVHDGMSQVLGAEPVYFSFEADYATDGPSVDIEGIRHVQNIEVSKGTSIGIAFPGRHALVRDSFITNPVNVMDTPGRDRWYRTTGARVFDATLMSPVLTLSRVQLKQGQQGRAITMDFSPILRQDMLTWR